MDRLLKHIDRRLKQDGGEGGVVAVMDDAYVYGPADKVLRIVTDVYMGEGQAVTGCEMNTKDTKGWFYSPAGAERITASTASQAILRPAPRLSSTRSLRKSAPMSAFASASARAWAGSSPAITSPEPITRA